MKVLKIIGIVYFVVVLILVGLGVYFYKYSKDEVLKDDSDLRLSKIEVVDSDNAFFDFEKAVKAIKVNSLEKKESQIEVALKDNETALNYFDQAALKLKYQDPSLVDPQKVTFDSPISNSLTEIRKLAKLKVLYADKLATSGKQDEAVSEALKTVKVGQLLNSSQSNLITWLVGVAIEKDGWEEIEKINPSFKVKSSAVSISQSQIGLNAALRMEYVMGVSVLNKIVDEYRYDKDIANTIRFGYYYKPNKTHNLLAENYRLTIQSVNKSCESFILPIVKSGGEDKQNLIFEENAIGKIINSIIITSLTSTKDKECEIEALRRKFN